MVAGGGDGLLRDGHGLLGPPGDRECKGQPAQTRDVRDARLVPEIGVGLQAGVDPTGQAMGGCLHEAAPPDVERVVTGIGLQRDRGLGVPDRGVGSPGVGAEGGGGGEAGQLRQLRGGGRVEELLGPTGGLEESLEGPPHQGGVGGDRRRGDQVGLVGGPAEPGAQVGELAVHPVERDTLERVRPRSAKWATASVGEVTGVTVTHLGDRPSGGELVFGELADRLQQPVAGVPTGTFHCDQRLADQRIQHVQQVQQVQLVQPVAATPRDGDGRGEVEPVGEHRTAIQHTASVVVEQVIGPCDGLVQRLVATQPAPRTRQQPEPVTEPVPHVLGAHRHHPRRGQLDRQRDPIQPTTDLRHRRAVILVVEGEPGHHCLGALHEQLYGRRPGPGVHVQRRHRPQMLRTDSQTLP